MKIKLIPFSFLEAVKQKDFNLAKSFLHEKLCDVTNEKLEQYFNDTLRENLTSESGKYYNLTYMDDQMFELNIMSVYNYNSYPLKSKKYEIIAGRNFDENDFKEDYITIFLSCKP